MKSIKYIFYAIGLSLVCAMLISCKPSPSTKVNVHIKHIQSKLSTTNAKTNKQQPPLPNLIVSTAADKIVIKRNPFIAYPLPKRNEPSTKLNKKFASLTLTQLKLLGNILGQTKRWAIIQSPQGQIEHIAVGEHVGKNYAKLIQIDEHAIVFERDIVLHGKWQPQRIKLYLNANKIQGS